MIAIGCRLASFLLLCLIWFTDDPAEIAAAIAAACYALLTAQDLERQDKRNAP